MSIKLFAKEHVAGIFRGFSEGGLEFHADLVLPYRYEFQHSPMHGQFLIVQLESEDEAVLGRITSISSQGRLASGAGEDYGLRAVAEDRPVPEDLREQYLKYKVDIRVLGILRVADDQLVFAPSHRRLPHVGSKVAFLSDQIMREVAGDGDVDGAAELGFLAFGEFIYSGADKRSGDEPWMRRQSPSVVPRFHVNQLVSRRTFVFARAGFGKSNLVKLLFSRLYASTPTVTKRGGRQVPVGTVLFDPDGEYFWPDDKDRPGLCDVPGLESQLVVFTNRQAPSPYYGSFIAGGIKLDIRRLRPADVISIALPPERQDQQNVAKLKALNQSDWHKLVDKIHAERNATDTAFVQQILRLDKASEVEAIAARSNMTRIVGMLHDPSSQMLDMLLSALKDGKLCVVDVSQIRGNAALILSGLILQKIFDRNQSEFTKAVPETIPTIAVVEEAQSVLGSGATEGPYVTWVKEGRKYDLGAVLITQQPGSITSELLSQGDNWFVFHLLSAGDLQAVKRANAHFSDDLLSSLLNEPIPGHAIFWSSAGGKTYPLSIRVLSFESEHPIRDSEYRLPPGETYATALRIRFDAELDSRVRQVEADPQHSGDTTVVSTEQSGEPTDASQVDALEAFRLSAIKRFAEDEALKAEIRSKGKPWRGVMEVLKQHLPETVTDSDELAYELVPPAMDKAFGSGKWTTEFRPSKSKAGSNTRWIVVT